MTPLDSFTEPVSICYGRDFRIVPGRPGLAVAKDRDDFPLWEVMAKPEGAPYWRSLGNFLTADEALAVIAREGGASC
jgi:hypothetical protein